MTFANSAPKRLAALFLRIQWRHLNVASAADTALDAFYGNQRVDGYGWVFLAHI